MSDPTSGPPPEVAGTVGPIRQREWVYRLVSGEGVELPFIRAEIRGDTPEGIVTVTVDGRIRTGPQVRSHILVDNPEARPDLRIRCIQFDVFADEIEKWVDVLAWYGAVCAGYTKPGPDGALVKPFGRIAIWGRNDE